jgi:hypothetical protein
VLARVGAFVGFLTLRLGPISAHNPQNTIAISKSKSKKFVKI